MQNKPIRSYMEPLEILENEVVIGEIRQPNPNCVAGDIYFGGRKSTINYNTEDIPLKSGREPFFCLGLLPAMRSGKSLLINGEINEQLLRGSEKIQEIFYSWNPGWQKIKIQNAVPVSTKKLGNGGSACFFSGGIDSWYTFLRHKDEVTHIIFIDGLDVRPDDHVLHAGLLGDLKRAAKHYGKQLIEVHTDLRGFFHQTIPWKWVFGAALVSVGHLLTDHFSKIYIPASYSMETIIPNGISPLVDYLWSTDKTLFFHDGCEANRMQRTELVVTSDIALQTLHVCRKNHMQEGNCGRCEKCQRTMLELLVNGGLDRCTTFPSQLNPRRLARISIDPDILVFWYSILERLKDNPNFLALYLAVKKAISRSTKTRERIFQGKRAGVLLEE